MADLLDRRAWLRRTTALTAVSASGWLGTLAARAAEKKAKAKKAVILLWMHGGPSHMDTFDLKPGHENGGPFKELKTPVPGLQFSEHLPKLAAYAKHLAVVRSLSSKEGDHGRATFLTKTGYLPQGPIQYPPLGAQVAHRFADEGADLPGFVSIAPPRALTPSAIGSGFLGPKFAPLVLGHKPTGSTEPATPDKLLSVPDLAPPPHVGTARDAERTALLRQMQKEFTAKRTDATTSGHQVSIEGALRLMSKSASEAFDLSDEKPAVRDAYGRGLFGQGCLLARRLVERGVPFVEVNLGQDADGLAGWDTHFDNFEAVKKLSGALDPAWAALLDDLKERGMLDDTLVVWMGEFGRTPKINQLTGRDHYPTAYSAVLCGGGVKGGQVIGKTTADGGTVAERPVSVPEFLATVYTAVGIDPTADNTSNIGRPIPIVEKTAKPMAEVLP
jgi:hypothetical protein